MKQRPWMSQKGAAAVELAIVFSLLILFIFGMIEFSLYLYNRHVITNAAREGARFGVVSRPGYYTNDEIRDEVIKYAKQYLVTFGADTLEKDDNDIEIKPVDDDLGNGFDPSSSRCVEFSYESGGSTHRCELEVKVNYRYHFLFLRNIGIDHMDIQSVATMKME